MELLATDITFIIIFLGLVLLRLAGIDDLTMELIGYLIAYYLGKRTSHLITFKKPKKTKKII